jgi:hypothetical protein
MRSPVRVQMHDEITPKGGKDQSITKEHPRALKRKRPDFMREDPLSWTREWSRQNDIIEGGKVRNVKRTHVREGVTEPGSASLAHSRGGSVPHFLIVKMMQH